MLSCTSMGRLQTNITVRQFCNSTENTIVLCSLTGNLKSQLQKTILSQKLTKINEVLEMVFAPEERL